MQTAAHDTTRITTDELALSDQATAAVMPACVRLDIAHHMRAKHVYNLLVDLVTLHDGGGNESEGRQIALCIHDFVDTLWSGAAATDEAMAARMELEADCREDHAAGMLAIEGESATLLEAHGHALTHQATASLTLARRRFSRARAIRSQRGVARQRLNINGAA